MKKYLFIFLLTFISFNSYADELSDLANKHGKLLTTAVTIETDGYVSEENSFGDLYSSFVQLPKYYDNHLVIETINNIIKNLKYTTIKPWTVVDSGVLSSYKLGNILNIYFRFDNVRHFIAIATEIIRE